MLLVSLGVLIVSAFVAKPRRAGVPWELDPETGRLALALGNDLHPAVLTAAAAVSFALAFVVSLHPTVAALEPVFRRLPVALVAVRGTLVAGAPVVLIWLAIRWWRWKDVLRVDREGPPRVLRSKLTTYRDYTTSEWIVRSFELEPERLRLTLDGAADVVIPRPQSRVSTETWQLVGELLGRRLRSLSGG
jgi:hypothetical protein